MENISAKKRMMFIMGEDYNFLTYNMFIILKGLNCVEGKSSLKDHRKLSFLIDFVSNSKLINILENNLEDSNVKMNDIDRDLLNQSYTNSILRLKSINQLVFTLTNEGILDITNKNLEKLSICLVKKNVADDFFKGNLFEIERQNMNRLKTIVKRISVKDISNVLDSLYYKHGVLNEQIIN